MLILFPIALSPDAMGNAWVEWQRKGLSARAMLHSVGRQYLDNTGALERSLDPYRTVDATLRWNRGGVEWRLDEPLGPSVRTQWVHVGLPL